MGEEQIAERIDANLTNTTIDDLRSLPFPMYEKRVQRITNAVKGKLIIKQYPSGGGADALTIRHLIEELKIKKNFVPDVVIVDYLNLCGSTRIKGGSDNSYNYIKYISEELRALAIEKNVQLFSATQVNRQGYNNSDIDLTNTAESMGLSHTADFFFVIISTEDMDSLNQVMFKQLKNRFGDVAVNRKFIVGLDKTKMKFYDVNQTAQTVSTSGKSEDGVDDSFKEDDKYKGTFKEKSDEKFRKRFSKWN
jgi:replicative DNA helicase